MKSVSRSMSEYFRKIAIVTFLVLAVLIAFAFIAILCMVFTPLNAKEDPDISTIGSKWVSEDGNISFSSYEKMLVLGSDAEKISFFEIEYFGIGSLSHKDNKSEILCQYFRNKRGDFYIIFIESEHSLDLSGGKIEVSYTGQELAELKVDSWSENEFTAVVTYADPAWDCFKADETIRFTQANDISDINACQYQLYFDGTGLNVDYGDMSSIYSVEMTLYTKEEFCRVYGLDAESMTAD